ncbi:hypothetical protein RhiirA5_406750 [Rhizophagus irregularis]|uniref:F-box domain-containing protein n=1 Tax=Rhizophagus irregularis TaxID=588596 RepID=A0A2N0QC84_9GLOM|nr:hypothetical protein RhiirA5_406750 [Rhizophagus irregularis]
MAQLTVDCLNDIFEYLRDDMKTLHSCILVNRLWCEVSVRFFWVDIRNYYTITACLPNDSKEILCKIGFHYLITTLKTPIFNYASFCKILSIDKIYYKIGELLINQKYISLKSDSLELIDHIKCIAVQEISRMFMNQSSSLKRLTFLDPNIVTVIPFIDYPGANNCLKNLTELYCNSNNSDVFFYYLSKTCHKISLLDIIIKAFISEELENLIFVQKNLNYLNITQDDDEELEDKHLLPSLMKKIPNNLNKLHLRKSNQTSLSFITKFTNLQELVLSLDLEDHLEGFEKLQFAIFPQLQILKITRSLPEIRLLVKFLENNGGYLKELFIGEDRFGYDFTLNLSIAKFCTNLRKLTCGYRKSELESFKIVLKSCKYLESFQIWCSGVFLNEKEVIEAVVKHSHENFSELILFHLFEEHQRLLPRELESLLISWKNRVPLNPLSLVIITDNDLIKSLDKYKENREIIKKYIKAGVIKEFKVADIEFNF